MKEESILESFKQYHNANWHDGDNTFDERTYAMSNNEDFDDPFVQYCFEHYEAGYHSGYEKACESNLQRLEAAYNSGFSDGRNGTPCEVVRLQEVLTEQEDLINDVLSQMEQYDSSIALYFRKMLWDINKT